MKNFADLRAVAERSLAGNIIELDSGPVLRAGSRQFQALWTRDFCFGARGLAAIGRADVVRSHLALLLAHLREADGLVPKYFDSLSIYVRYFKLTLLGKTSEVQEPLTPGFKAGIPPHESIDSNALVLLVADDYARRSGDRAWWDLHEPALVKAYRYYDPFLEGGILRQGAFADWQDSVNRAGWTFYTNILYAAASERLLEREAFGISRAALAQQREAIRQRFFEPATGLYHSIAGEPYVSLDGLLLAIDLGVFPAASQEARALYAALQAHPLWTGKAGIPGFATFPNYPDAWVDPSVRWFGVRHYHDSVYWSWLLALSAKVAGTMGDDESRERILSRLEEAARRDGAICEIYHPDPELKPYRSRLYRPESPFSWGAGMILDALSAR
jgi:glycogen debranching enzyme